MKFAYLIEPPFNFVDDKEQVKGCDVELAQHVWRELDLGDFEPIETEFAQLLPGVAEGRWKMTTGLFATPEREKLAQFSRPIWALPDGILVKRGNPHHIEGYASASKVPGIKMAVIRDQVQHKTALDLGFVEDRITIFETYNDAAQSVLEGNVDGYASVGRAHSGFLQQHPEMELEVVHVQPSEKRPAFGSFAFNRDDTEFKQAVDEVLENYLGSDAHRQMMASYGFDDSEIDLLLDG